MNIVCAHFVYTIITRFALLGQLMVLRRSSVFGSQFLARRRSIVFRIATLVQPPGFMTLVGLRSSTFEDIMSVRTATGKKATSLAPPTEFITSTQPTPAQTGHSSRGNNSSGVNSSGDDSSDDSSPSSSGCSIGIIAGWARELVLR